MPGRPLLFIDIVCFIVIGCAVAPLFMGGYRMRSVDLSLSFFPGALVLGCLRRAGFKASLAQANWTAAVTLLLLVKEAFSRLSEGKESVSEADRA